MNTNTQTPATTPVIEPVKVAKNNNDNLHITIGKGGKSRGKHGHGKLSNTVVVVKGETVKLVSRNAAASLVSSQGYAYGKKSAWKEKVRNPALKVGKKVVADIPTITEVKKKKKRKNDKARKGKESNKAEVVATKEVVSK